MIKKLSLEDALAENLARLRGAHAELNTYAKLGKRAGIGGGTVERVEKKQSSATLGTVEKLAGAFGLSPLDLLGEPDNQKPMSFTDLNALEAQLVMLFRTIDEQDRDRLLLYANDLYNVARPGQRSAANPYPDFKRRSTDQKK